jgi:hypothetical protein
MNEMELATMAWPDEANIVHRLNEGGCPSAAVHNKSADAVIPHSDADQEVRPDYVGRCTSNQREHYDAVSAFITLRRPEVPQGWLNWKFARKARSSGRR